MRLCQHQISPIAGLVIGIGAWQVQHAGTTLRGQTVGGSSCSGQFGPGRAPAEMISDGCAYANGEVLIKGVGEHLLPTAQSCAVWWLSLTVAAPGTRASHAYVFCDLRPGQASVTQLQDLIGGGGMSGSAARQGETGTLELLADRAHCGRALDVGL
jgi:hypothetical protein